MEREVQPIKAVKGGVPYAITVLTHDRRGLRVLIRRGLSGGDSNAITCPMPFILSR